MKNIVLSTFQSKCPYCHEGDVFKKTKNPLQLPEMNESCSCCHKKFEGEPGYFIGAMYLSYAIATATGMIIFFISKFLFNVDSLHILLGLIIASIILISYQNYKWSRIIWLKIFPPT